MLIYQIGDKKMQVSPENKEAFEAEYPDAVLIGDETSEKLVEEDVINQPTQSDTGEIIGPKPLIEGESSDFPITSESDPNFLKPLDTDTSLLEPKTKPSVKLVSALRDENNELNVILNFNGQKIQVSEKNFDSFLEENNIDHSDIDIPGYKEEAKSNVPFSEKITSSKFETDTDKIMIGDKKASSMGYSGIEKINKELINQYKSAYKETGFEFSEGSLFSPGFKIKGENGRELTLSSTEFKGGNIHEKINTFIANNQDLNQRKKIDDYKNNDFWKSFEDKILGYTDETGWHSDMANRSFEENRKSGYNVFGAIPLVPLEFGPEDRFAEKNYNSFEEFVNGKDGYENKESLREFVRNQSNTPDYISDYAFDNIFENAVNSAVAKERMQREEKKFNTINETLKNKYPEAYNDIKHNEVDYRDMPQYTVFSNTGLERRVNELTGDKKRMGNLNFNWKIKSQQLKEFIDNGEEGSEKAIKLGEEIKQIREELDELNETVIGDGTDLYIDHSTNSVIKIAEEDLPKENPNIENIFDLFKTHDNKYQDMKKNLAYQDLEEEFVFNVIEENNLKIFGNEKFDVIADFSNMNMRAYFGKLDNPKLKIQKSYPGQEKYNQIKGISMRDLGYLQKMGVVFSEWDGKEFSGGIPQKLEYKDDKEYPSPKGEGYYEDIFGNIQGGRATLNPMMNKIMDYNSAVANNAAEKAALEKWYVLNVDPADMRRTGEGKGERGTNWQNTKQWFATFGESIVETWTEDYDTINSESDKMAVVQKIGDRIGVPWSKEQQKNFQQTNAEFAGQTLGAVPQIAVEFAILNYVTGGIASATGLSESLMAMRMGRVIHGGKVVNRGNLLNAVYAATGSKNSKAIKDFLNHKVLDKAGKSLNKYKNGKSIYKIKGASTLEKAQALGITMLMEEGKMQLMELPTGSGAAFAFSGQMLNSITSRMGLYFTAGGIGGKAITAKDAAKIAAQPLIPALGSGGMQVGTAVNLANKALKLGRTGPQFAISAEFAVNVEAMIADVAGGKDMQTFIDEHYNDLELDEIERRTLGNILTGFGFGIGHSKTLARGVRGDGWTFTRSQIKKIQAKAYKIASTELAKKESERNVEKLNKYQELYYEMQRQLDVVSGVYKNNTAQALVKRVNKYIKNSKSDLVEGKEYHVQMGDGREVREPYSKEEALRLGLPEGTQNPNGKIIRKAQGKYIIDGAAQKITTKEGKEIMVFNALHFTKGQLPHELGHLLTEKLKYTEAEFDAIAKIIEPEVEANGKEWLREKNQELDTNYKSIRELINARYTKAGQKQYLNEEYVMRIVEFFGDKTFTNAMIKGNAFFGINKAVKQFYEKRLIDLQLFDNNYKNIGVYNAQDAMKALSRIANWKGGKKELLKEWKNLQDLVQFEPTGEVVNTKTGKIVGKHRNKSSLDLLVESTENAKEEKRLFQRVDKTMNDRIKDGTWETNKKNIAVELAYEYVIPTEAQIRNAPSGKEPLPGEIGRRLQLLKDQGRLKNFTREDMESVAYEFATAEKDGLRSKIEAYDSSRMKDGISLAKYLNSSTRQGPLIDVALKKFIQENPKYNNIIVSTAEKGVTEKMNILDQTTFKKTGELGTEVSQQSKRQTEGFGPMQFRGMENISIEPFTKIPYIAGFEGKAPNITDVNGSISYKAAAEFFGARNKTSIDGIKNKLENYYSGKVSQIGDFTYAQEIKDGVRVPSEVGSIQTALARNIKDIVWSVNQKNLIPERGADLRDVSPAIVGKAIGQKGTTQSEVYEATGNRPKNALELKLKPKYNPRVNEKTAIENWEKLFGIVRGDLNVYTKAEHGNNLKWIVRNFGKNLDAQILAEKLKPVKENFIQEVTDLTAGTSMAGKSSLNFELSTRQRRYLEKEIMKPGVLNVNQIINDPIFKNINDFTKNKLLQTYSRVGSPKFIEASNVLDVVRIAEKEGISPRDVANRYLTNDSKWSQRESTIGEMFNYNYKHRSSKDRLQTDYYKNKLRPFHKEYAEAFLHPDMTTAEARVVLSDLGVGNYKVLHPETGKINRLNLENYLGEQFVGTSWGKLSRENRIEYVKNLFGADISKNTKENTISISKNYYQQSYSQAQKLKYEKLQDQFNKNEITQEKFETESMKLVSGSKSTTPEGILKDYKNYVKASNDLLVKKYNWLWNKYHTVRKTGNKELTKETHELVNGHLAELTNVGEGSKGAQPVKIVSTFGEVSPAQLVKRAEGLGQKDLINLHFEHMNEFVQTNSVDFQNILKIKNPKKAQAEIVKMVENLGQAITTRQQQYYKDFLVSEGGGGKREAINPVVNTMLSKGQGETSILLGTGKGVTAADAIVQMYSGKPRTLDKIIKDIGENNLSSDGFKVKRHIENRSSDNKIKENNRKLLEKLTGRKSSLDLTNDQIINQLRNIDKAIELARSRNKIKKGISVLDFDDTVATSKSKVIVTMPNGKTKKINATEFAKQHESLIEQGAKFDFSNFNKVVDGKKGPLFNKLEKAVNKFGNENVFILTARAPEAAPAIKAFLDGLGVKLKTENIVGLADGTPAAKAQWMLNKTLEGFNDFYFSDDAVANTKAVKRVLDIVDVNSKVQLARKSSLDLNREINEMIEYATGIGKEKVYSKAKAEISGKGKGVFGAMGNQSIYMPNRASDFYSLTNALLGKGKQGLKNREWFKEHLSRPFARGDLSYQTERRVRMMDYVRLRNQLKQTGEKYYGMFKKQPLNEKIEKGEVWTNQHAIRVYNWAKQGTLPKDISKSDVKKLVRHVNNNPRLKAFAEELVRINKGDGYPAPREMWVSETITQDLILGTEKVSRQKHMKEFIENADIIFSPENLNKMEAALGKSWRRAMEDSIERMKTGTNRPSWARGNKWEADMLDFMSGSISGIMFLNTRSAILQQVSIPNYINVTDNNIFKAARAFSNVKQFSKDYIELMNDQWSLNRRDGLRYNIQESEIAEALSRSTNKPMAIINWALKKGFVMTKYADSHATAFGGASFYRNRINTYKKQGFSEAEAKERAKEDWREMSDGTQQTSRMDRVSAEQKSVAGRLILPFTSVQLAYGRRYIDDPARDLMNGRYEGLVKGENSALKKIGQIIYGSAIQGVVFHGLQQGVFKILFEDGDTLDGEELEVANATLDGILVGSGILGKTVATFKNWLIKVAKESKKKNPKYTDTATELLKISPPIDKKFRQVKGALGAFQYDMDKIDELSLDNPALVASAKMIEATTNAPTDRFLTKSQNVEAALEEDRAHWQRPFLMGGWSDYNFKEDDKDNFIGPRNPYNRRRSTNPYNRRRSSNPFNN